MAILPILWAPDPILKTRCAPVERIDKDVRRFVDDMIETMHDAKGIGLAAPQVGVVRRIAVVDGRDPDLTSEPICMVNPEIIEQSLETITSEEGCLSLPGHFAMVTRPAAVRIAYLDRDGTAREMTVKGVIGICAQHEIDHLNGILFVDHLSSLKRNMILKKMIKAKKELQRNGPG